MEEEVDDKRWGARRFEGPFFNKTRFAFCSLFWQATNNELSSQISSLRRPGQSDTMEVRSLSARAVNAERRLQNAQNQLLASENKIEVLTKKNVDVDNKWEVRVKEYENMLKRAEERYKKERQGGKEAVKEMENTIK